MATWQEGSFGDSGTPGEVTDDFADDFEDEWDGLQTLRNDANAIKTHWGQPHACLGLGLAQRRRLLTLTAASGGVANMAVAAEAAGLALRAEVAEAAAAACQVEALAWVARQRAPLGGALPAAARAGHATAVQWLLMAEAGRGGEVSGDGGGSSGGGSVAAADWSSDAVLAALCGGHEQLAEALLTARRPGDQPPPSPIELLTAAAAGCKLAALRRVYDKHVAVAPPPLLSPLDARPRPSALLAAAERGYALAAAAGSPTPDWLEKVLWLERLLVPSVNSTGHPQGQSSLGGGSEGGGGDGGGAGGGGFLVAWPRFAAVESAAAVSPDAEALVRVAWLLGEQRYPVGDLGAAIAAAAATGNLRTLEYLLTSAAAATGGGSSGRISGGGGGSSSGGCWWRAARAAAAAGRWGALLALDSRGCLEATESLLQVSARSGHWQACEWLAAGRGGRGPLPRLTPALWSAALRSGSPPWPLLTWLAAVRCSSDGSELAAAAAGGNEAALMWLMARGGGMMADGSPYVDAARQGDLHTMAALRRLGVPLGPAGPAPSPSPSLIPAPASGSPPPTPASHASVPRGHNGKRVSSRPAPHARPRSSLAAASATAARQLRRPPLSTLPFRPPPGAFPANAAAHTSSRAALGGPNQQRSKDLEDGAASRAPTPPPTPAPSPTLLVRAIEAGAPLAALQWLAAAAEGAVDWAAAESAAAAVWERQEQRRRLAAGVATAAAAGATRTQAVVAAGPAGAGARMRPKRWWSWLGLPGARAAAEAEQGQERDEERWGAGGEDWGEQGDAGCIIAWVQEQCGCEWEKEGSDAAGSLGPAAAPAPGEHPQHEGQEPAVEEVGHEWEEEVGGGDETGQEPSSSSYGGWKGPRSGGTDSLRRLDPHGEQGDGVWTERERPRGYGRYGAEDEREAAEVTDEVGMKGADEAALRGSDRGSWQLSAEGKAAWGAGVIADSGPPPGVRGGGRELEGTGSVEWHQQEVRSGGGVQGGVVYRKEEALREAGVVSVMTTAGDAGTGPGGGAGRDSGGNGSDGAGGWKGAFEESGRDGVSSVGGSSSGVDEWAGEQGQVEEVEEVEEEGLAGEVDDLMAELGL
ncbi:hypothetical protein HYH03_005133 [Edaphochlamys debaryana]|uniref:Uncharacterized protein n=1 Tax=Edaphochlamys debaryana TaxID=47281 RepID=A0A836C1G1_9CHLO|nr:hypothetical protein HYH03_005133 [Edaphochlamys debaryana]|eukprot:KAG2496720.1 hypothetical protein HYH03_005133 [Edaphochlamys debaryana]